MGACRPVDRYPGRVHGIRLDSAAVGQRGGALGRALHLVGALLVGDESEVGGGALLVGDGSEVGGGEWGQGSEGLGRLLPKKLLSYTSAHGLAAAGEAARIRGLCLLGWALDAMAKLGLALDLLGFSSSLLLFWDGQRRAAAAFLKLVDIQQMPTDCHAAGLRLKEERICIMHPQTHLDGRAHRVCGCMMQIQMCLCWWYGRATPPTGSEHHTIGFAKKK